MLYDQVFASLSQLGVHENHQFFSLLRVYTELPIGESVADSSNLFRFERTELGAKFTKVDCYEIEAIGFLNAYDWLIKSEDKNEFKRFLFA